MTTTVLMQSDSADHTEPSALGKRGLTLALISVSLAIVACFFVIQSVAIVHSSVQPTHSSAAQFLLNWLLFISGALSAGFVWDLSRGETLLSDVKRAKSDLAIALGLVALASLVRCVGPVTGADDELLHLGDVIRLHTNPASGGLTTTSLLSVPYELDWAIFFINEVTYKFVDTFMLMKAISIMVAAGSIGVWYLIARIYFTRSISVCGGLLVVFWGWHYVNSRFIYVYPHDMLVVAVGVVAAIIATRRRLVSAAVLLGACLAYSIALKKVSIMLFPFVAYLFLDAIVTNKGGKRLQLIGIGLVVASALALTFSPWLTASLSDLNPANWRNGTSFFRYQDALQKRDSALIAAAGGPIFVYPYMVMDGFRQFFYKSNDAFRHFFNPERALLDPVFSILFALGTVICVCRAVRSQRERFAIVGLLVFMMPMVLSYPLDSSIPQGMARRLLGSVGFVAFISMIGMEWLFSKVRAPKWGTAVVAGLTVCSIALNVWVYVSVYRGQGLAGWLGWQGVEHSAPVRLVREVARRGERVILVDNPAVIQDYVISDLPHARIGRSGKDIKNYLKEFPADPVTVIIPATNEARQSHTKQLQEFLIPEVPLGLWTPAQYQIFGQPSYYVARVGPRS